MSALDVWRAEQHEHLALASDHQLAAFLASVDPARVHLDRVTAMTPVEVRMLTHRSIP